MRLAIAALLIPLNGAAFAAPVAAPIASPAPADRGTAEAVVEAFRAALTDGDKAAALAMLDDHVLILESGHAERSKAEYAAHHLDSDIAFSKAVKSTVTRRSSDGAGDLAWVASEGRSTGRFRGRPVDSPSTETMILRRFPAGWRIIHIHWSSGKS